MATNSVDNSADNIKILVSYHAPFNLLKSDIFVPIHVGRVIGTKESKDGSASDSIQWMQNKMIGDDTFDNISFKNRTYCELTAIYWAWKNQVELGNPSYIGFMHYRRHLCFDIENQDTPDQFGLIYSDKLDNNYIKKFKLDDDSIRQVVTGSDIVTTVPFNVEGVGSKSNYHHYQTSSKHLYIKDYDTVLSIIDEKYPEYSEYARDYNQLPTGYYTNIFIMKTGLFNQYAEWLFSILFEAENRINISKYNIQEARIFGYLSEWLFGIWYTYQKHKENRICIELPRTMVRNSSLEKSYPLPAFKNNNIAIAMAVDNSYINYLGVAIKSIIDNSSKNFNYDINIIHSDIEHSKKKLILDSIKEHSNFSVRFHVITPYLKEIEIKQFHESAHITIASYYRLFSPIIFRCYEKILYLDSDLVVNRDVAELFESNSLEGKLAGVIRDTELIRWYFSDTWIQKYISEKVKINNVMNYFNAGVLLLNISQLNKEKMFSKFIDILKNQFNNIPYFHDQDVLNKAFEGKTCFLDGKWNVLYHTPIFNYDWKEKLPASLLYEYLNNRENPYIIHYAGGVKPWTDANQDMSEYFWKYARNSVFYERIIYQNTKGIFPSGHLESRNHIFTEKELSKAKYRYFKYRILSKIFRKKHYKYKKQNQINLIRDYKDSQKFIY